jgi:hypothetical protein
VAGSSSIVRYKTQSGEFSVAERLFAEAAPETLGDMVAEGVSSRFQGAYDQSRLSG